MVSWYFNPQGPRGPRRIPNILEPVIRKFQSTRPSRASTDLAGYVPAFGWISIHKALAGLDEDVPALKPQAPDFNPQGPRGPRQVKTFGEDGLERISIHKALAGLDAYVILTARC